MTALLSVEELHLSYRLPRSGLFRSAPSVAALAGINLAMTAGESLGVVGESGSGKSTLARAILGLERPTHGRITVLGQDFQTLRGPALRRARADVQMVFQDPFGSLDPRSRVSAILAEPLTALTDDAPATRRERVVEMLAAVGLRSGDADRFPHEFSGGQRQRIAIARALIARPRLVVADEPVSALDVSVRAQILNLLQDLQEERGVTFLLISHDLAVVDYVCDRVAVLYKGRLLEQGPTAALLRQPAHPYTRLLLDSVPPDPTLARSLRRPAQPGLPNPSPSPMASGAGCCYAAHCPIARPRCGTDVPPLRPVTPGRQAACHRAEDMLARQKGFG